MAGASKPHTRHHNSNHTNEIAMEKVTPPSKRTSQNTSKSSHKKSKSNATMISLYRDPSQMEFWYGYPVMEIIAYEAGITPFSVTTPIDELIASGYVASEAAELRSAACHSHAFNKNFGLQHVPMASKVNTSTLHNYLLTSR